MVEVLLIVAVFVYKMWFCVPSAVMAEEIMFEQASPSLQIKTNPEGVYNESAFTDLRIRFK